MKIELMCLACDSVFMGNIDGHCLECGAEGSDLVDVTDGPEGHYEGDMGSMGRHTRHEE